jgi:transposase
VDHARLNDGAGAPARRRPKKSAASAEALGRSRGGFTTKVHALVDALGNPMRFILTPGQAGDCPQAEPLLAFCNSKEQRALVKAVLGDTKATTAKTWPGISKRSSRTFFEAEAVIPSRKNAKEPREIDRELYKDRNKIERFLGRAKHYRRVATRYDKTARNYLAFLHVASIMTLLL